MRPASTSCRSAIDNVEPDEVSEEEPPPPGTGNSSGCASHAEFDVNINSVLGSGIRNPEDARTINRRARELGFSTSLGVIHDGSGRLRPLGPSERAVFDDVSRRVSGGLQVLQNLYSGNPGLQRQPRRGQAERVAVPGGRTLLVCVRRWAGPLLLPAARVSRHPSRLVYD